MSTPLVVGNWKMNGSLHEARTLAKEISETLGNTKEVKIVVCPPYPYLLAVKNEIEKSLIRLGAQNCHWEEKGALTGEVSITMVSEICEYVIVGHSERRQFFSETDEIVNQKIASAIKFGLSPILCVGENLSQRENGEASTVVSRQIQASLEGIQSPDGLTIAYEPIWAIGTGVPATPEIVSEVMGGSIINTLNRLYGEQRAEQIPLLYGGSVTGENVEAFVALDCVNGALVGGASLRSNEFSDIALITSRVKTSD